MQRMIAWLMGRFSPPDVGAPAEYRVFTRKFDRIVRGDQLDSILGRQSLVDRHAHEQAWAAFQGALQGWRTTAHLAALEASERIRQVTDQATLADTAITLLVDQSGSMRGQSMLLAAAATDVAQDFLRHLGVSVEILGFTTTSWRGGRSRAQRRWRDMGPSKPGRLCDLLHIIYRSADDPRASTGGWSLRPMLRPDLPKENVDGEAIEWAALRLRARPERNKVLVVISDGAPVDDSTLLANDLGILDRHLRQVLESLQQAADIKVGAIGIGFDVDRYYATTTVVETPEDLGTGLIDLLERVVTGPLAVVAAAKP
jgi:cobaltochelatase CobT